jgi:hypothetical protein
MDLILDPERLKEGDKWEGTGLYVRAFNPISERWEGHDIVFLAKDSLLSWLRSRGGDNSWAENVVGILLGHGHLHPLKEEKDA